MLQINEDINDELFRRAAESYPLKTDNPDWEPVLNKMNADASSTGAEPVAKKRKNNYRFLLLLLLMIPLAIFENKRSEINESLAGKSNTTKDKVIAKSTTAGQNNPVTNLNNNDAKSQSPVNDQAQKTEKTTEVEPVPVQISTQKNNNSITPVTGIKTNTVDDNAVATNSKQHFSSKQRSRVKIKNAQASADEEVVVRYPDSKNKSKKKTPVIPVKNIVINTEKEAITSLEKDAAPEVKAEVAEAGKKTETLTTEDSKEQAPADKNKTATTDTISKKVEKEITKKNEPIAAKEIKKDKTRTKHFYAGLIAAPDLSTIKLQSLKKVGFNYGFLIGYKLTKKISIEAGLLQDRKYYSTKGKYFSTKNVYLYPNATIEYVDGVCKMLELPINVSYTFSKKARSTWFGSVGVSSYFMQHESYTYDISYNGYRYPKDYDYSNKSTSLLALINISAGYTYKLGRIGDLRFEPYIKLPVNKIGTGELPIQSAGIFIGFTKDIF